MTTTTTDPMDLYISTHCDQKANLNLAIAQAVACVPGCDADKLAHSLKKILCDELYKQTLTERKSSDFFDSEWPVLRTSSDEFANNQPCAQTMTVRRESVTAVYKAAGFKGSVAYPYIWVAEQGRIVKALRDKYKANNPNTNPVVENSNKQIRNVLRRIAQANRTTNQNDGKKKPWQSYWVGPQQIYFKQMIKAVNSRPDVSLGRTSPLVVWDAYRDNDNDIVQQTQGAQIRDADKRRGPSRIQPHAFFRKGQTVRRISTHYTKDGIRSNMSKQGNRWSLSTYTIHTVQKFNNAPPQYKLTLHSGKKPSDFKTDADGVSTVWYSHDQLQLNWADVDAPQALMDNTVLAPAGLAVGDRVAVAWVRVRETGASVDTWTIVYANLPQRLASGQLEAIRDDETWHEGDVAAKNVAQNWVRIKFDDGTVARLSFQPANNSYVEAGKYDKM